MRMPLVIRPVTSSGELAPTGAIPHGPPAVPAGIPSDLLRRRPDIRSAEARIHAATARIGVATAELYPKFGLSGSLTLEARSFDDLGSVAQSTAWSLVPGMSWNIFAGGRLRAR